MRRWPQYLCAMFGHGRIEDLDGRPIKPWGAITGCCARCGYIGMVDPETGRLFWS